MPLPVLLELQCHPFPQKPIKILLCKVWKFKLFLLFLKNFLKDRCCSACHSVRYHIKTFRNRTGGFIYNRKRVLSSWFPQILIQCVLTKENPTCVQTVSKKKKIPSHFLRFNLQATIYSSSCVTLSSIITKLLIGMH